MDRKYNDLIGDILKTSEEKDNYEGQGKPLPKAYLEMDTYQHFQKIARDAGYLPPWLQLQKEISQLVHSCKTDLDVRDINEKISKYNTMCPHPMQRNPICLNKLEEAKKTW